MADFRRWFTALAVLALMAGLANAQIGTAGSTTAGPLSCTANAAATPQLRSEGYTELIGDILITCIGGPTYPQGSQIPQTNITVYVTPNIPITSRLMNATSVGGGGTGGVSEVLLIVDDAGSTLPTAVSGYGPKAPQLLCADTGGAGGCPAFVSSTTGSDGLNYEVSVTASGGTTASHNVYQGNLNQVGANTVTFYGVPVLPPVTTGVTRTFRITNIRVPTVGLGNGAGIQVFLSTSPSTVLPVSLASLPVGIVADPGLITSLQNHAFTVSGAAINKTSSPSTLQQCNPIGATPVIDLVFTEGFATSFKTRAVPLTNTQYAAQDRNIGAAGQNIPGGLYGGFAANSESGFIFPQLTATTGGSNPATYTAGLADFGTRLKAVFTNIPAGITLYVSAASTSQAALPYTGTGATGVPGGQTTAPLALLWTPSTANGVGGSEGTRYTSSFNPNTNPVYSNNVPLTANSSGVATAVWEVVNANPSAIDQLIFTVSIGFVTAPGSGITASNPYGLPQVTTILGNPVNNVSLSFAPEPTYGAFAASAATVPGTNPIPRFAIVHPFSGPFANIILCQTTLLYPFVTANPAGGLGQGFDTGLAIANTSVDPFLKLGIATNNGTGIVAIGAGGAIIQAATLAEVGSCTLYPYGVSISSTGVQSAAPSPLPGCDTVANPVPGTNCFPIVQPGSVQTVLASQVFPTFQGYVIAVCNFQYAHGYAAVTDLGLRGLFSSYLALELNAGALAVNPRGVSIEQLVH